MVDKIFYNEASASKLGWDPSWFGVKLFDEDLVHAIKAWQRKQGIKPDGMCGPSTHRRIYTERQSNIDDHKPQNIEEKEKAYLVYQGNFIDIAWPRVVLWSEEKGLKLNGGYTPYYEKRDIKMFMNHWDVCLNSASCARVLNKRGISVHFCIDNDGTIYQLIDINHAAWHAGSKKLNHCTVGVEIANAYYPKYQSWYVKNGFGERPLLTGETIHGRDMETFTGFYDVQIKALQALWEAIYKGVGIPLKCPTDQAGNTLKKVSSSVASGRYKGFVSHYHATSRKIDCAGLDINNLLKDLE